MNELSKLLKAIGYAAEQHKRQRRKGIPENSETLTPYINHVLRVANLLNDAGITDVDILCAAVLHDTIEDTDTTQSHLRRQFGDRVVSLVLEVTDDKTLPKMERKRLQIEHAPELSHEAALIKLADKVDNIRDLSSEPPNWPPERVQAYFEHARQVVDNLPSRHATLLEYFERLYQGSEQV